MNKLIVNLDATALGHSACIKDLYLTVIGELDEQGKSNGGYREKLSSANLVYGTAIHKYLDICHKTQGDLAKAAKYATEAFNVPMKDQKMKPHLSDLKHMLTVGYNIWNDFCLQDQSFQLIELSLPCYVCGGKGAIKTQQVEVETLCHHCKGQKILLQPATEITFSIKYWEDDSVIVNLCGTIDKIGKFVNGGYAIGDWKTTSAWDNQGYFQQYELSRQLRVYALALRLMGNMYPDSTLGRLGLTNVGCFIDAIFINKEANDTKAIRSDVYPISPSDLDAFQLTLDDKIQQLLKSIKTGYLPKEGILNGSCIKPYSKCAFWDCCRTNANIERVLLKRDFKQWEFNPLRYNE